MLAGVFIVFAARARFIAATVIATAVNCVLRVPPIAELARQP